MWTWSAANPTARLSDEIEVAHPGDSGHGVVDAVTFEAAVAEDIPGLHAGEYVLDAGADLLLVFFVKLFPVGQLFAFVSPVGHHEPGARVAAVSDRHGLADGGLRAGLLPRLAVSAIPGQRSADRDDKPGVSIDDDLAVRGVPIVLGLLGDGVTAGGHQGAVHDRHGEPLEPYQRQPRGLQISYHEQF